VKAGAARAWRWITGGPKPMLPPHWTTGVFIARVQEREGWVFRFAPCVPAGLAISYTEAPNFIHRALQRLLLGFTWEMK
jgi:hypothetical protein